MFDARTALTLDRRQVRRRGLRAGRARLTLTDEGELFHANAMKLLAELEDMERLVSRNRALPKGLLRVNAEKSKVTNRFYRLDSGRTSPGVGLGLALVNSVAKLHGGTFDPQDNFPGLRAVLRIASLEHGRR